MMISVSDKYGLMKHMGGFMLPSEISKELHEVPESVIKEAARWAGTGNNFEKLLKAAKIFRFAGAKPIFLANHDATKICCTSEETREIIKLH